MKNIIFCLMLVFSTYSFADSVDVTHKFNLSGELKDCKIFKATNEKSPTHTFYSEEFEYDTINKSDTINFNGVKYKTNKNELDMTKSIEVNGKTYFKVK